MDSFGVGLNVWGRSDFSSRVYVWRIITESSKCAKTYTFQVKQEEIFVPCHSVY
jgi:hypothetical protein